LNVGIDLGTTFSLAALINAQGVPTLVPDASDGNEYRTPSVVHVDRNSALVGAPLELRLLDEPGLPIARGFKQAMGGDDVLLNDALGRGWSAEALSALVLRKLLRDVEAFAAEPVDRCMLTVPANFNDAQRRATLAAARLAGLAQVELIEEPIAAAAFHGFNERAAEQTLFVYDFGGGTFDATLIQISDGRMFVLATDGHNGLGGRSIDAALAARMARECQVDMRTDPAAQETLRRAAEEAKISLSRPGQALLRRSLVVGGRVAELGISAAQVAAVVEPVVEETLVVSRRCLDSAALGWGQVDAVLMVGGSSLLPQVRQKLAKESGKPAAALLCRHPHQAVAYGAALLAEARSNQEGAEAARAVAPYHLGLRVRDAATGRPRLEVMVKRNTPLPARHTATFYTTRSDQTRLVLDVVQSKGDDDVIASLGFFAFGPLRRPRKNYPVEVTLAYDAEGLVRVTARDPLTGEVIERQLVSDESPDLVRIARARELLGSVSV